MKTEARESYRSLCNAPGEEINKELSHSAAETGMERRDEGEVHRVTHWPPKAAHQGWRFLNAPLVI